MAKRYGILVDIDSCIGCGICVVACKEENNLPPYTGDRPGTFGLARNQVLQYSEGAFPDLSTYNFPLQCMNCANPPCVEACPQNAISKNEDGVVLIARGKCDACVNQPGGIKKCIPACPYGAIQFDEAKGVADVCTLCIHRISRGLEPACVRACYTDTLIFGDLEDPESNLSKALKSAGDRFFTLKPEEGTAPSILYLRPKKADKETVFSINTAKRLYGFKEMR